MEKISILIVEDHLLTIANLKAHLLDWGYHIFGKARSGEAALAMLGDSLPDLVLMDIDLGSGINGIETALKMREAYDFPIIFLTAFQDRMTMEKARSARPNAYLTKPFSEASLAFAIDEAVSGASQAVIQAHANPPTIGPMAREESSWLLAEHIFVKKDSSYKKVAVADIRWIQADRQYLHLQTESDTYLVATNLANFAHQFTHPDLLRVSRSHIVNIHHIDSIEEQHTLIVAGKAISIGKSYRQEVHKRFRFLKTTR